MTCATPVNVSATGKGDLRGLCLEHALKLVSSLPEEWLENHARLNSGRHGDDQSARTAFAEYVTIVHRFDRCGDCPTIPRADAWKGWPKGQQLFSGRLGSDCYREARASADEKYKPLPTLKLGVFDTSEEVDAAAVTFQAAFLIEAAWASEINGWPRCENCPAPARPVPNSRDQSVERAVLEALAAHGVPMSTSDLNALKIKGFSKNTSNTIMSSLLESGSVSVTARGPAKFYGLA